MIYIHPIGFHVRDEPATAVHMAWQESPAYFDEVSKTEWEEYYATDNRP